MVRDAMTFDAASFSLAPGLRAKRSVFRETESVIVEDPARGRFFRLDPASWAFATTLDRQGDLDAARAAARAAAPHDPFGPLEEARLLQFLAAQNLLKGADEAPSQLSFVQNLTRLAARVPLVVRVPLGDPDWLIDRLSPIFGGFLSPRALPVLAAASFLALMTLIIKGDTLTAQTVALIEPQGLILFGLAWLMMKVVHELAHGVTAKRYGCAIPEAGALLVFGFPVGGYVDATSTWRLPKNQRLHVALAGAQGEVFLAVTAIIVWGVTPPGALSTFLYAAALGGGVSALVFNANPLMRFDGYYALCDWLERPNLYGRGARAMQASFLHLIFGRHVERAMPPGDRLERIYGWSALAWRITIMVSLSLGAAQIFGVAGGIVAGVFVAGVIVSAVQTTSKLMSLSKPSRRGRLRGAMIGGLVVCALGGFVTLTLTRDVATAPAWVQYRDPVDVRAATAGFVKERHVPAGAQVAADTPLAAIEERDLQLAYDQSSAERRKSDIRMSQFLATGEADAARITASERLIWAQREDDLKRRLEGLSVSAPHAATVIAWHVRPGEFVRRGDRLATLADPRSLWVEAYVTPNDAQALADGTIRARFVPKAGRVGPRPLELASVDAEASLTAPDGLTMAAGGPLRVRRTRDGAALLSPRVRVRFRLTLEEGERLLHPGQVGRAVWRRPRDPDPNLKPPDQLGRN